MLLNTGVCTENVIRFDLLIESLNVGRDGRADILPLESGWLDLRQVVKSYASYFSTARTHRALAKDARVSRPIQHCRAAEQRDELAPFHVGHGASRAMGDHITSEGNGGAPSALGFSHCGASLGDHRRT
jgi:hypothetical protein